MEYLYQQRPMPTNAKGVSVHVTAIDPNGNFQDLGTTTSDLNGNFGITWTPPVEGKYQIIAAFDGTKSYGGSSASTYMAVVLPSAASPAVVTPTPAATEPVTPVSPTPVQTPVSPSPTQAPPPATADMTTTYVAIAAAVVIIAVAAAAIVLRKRK